MVNNVGEFMLVESAHVIEFVEVLFYPWFKSYFLSLLTHYHTLPYPKHGKI